MLAHAENTGYETSHTWSTNPVNIATEVDCRISFISKYYMYEQLMQRQMSVCSKSVAPSSKNISFAKCYCEDLKRWLNIIIPQGPRHKQVLNTTSVNKHLSTAVDTIQCATYVLWIAYCSIYGSVTIIFQVKWYFRLSSCTILIIDVWNWAYPFPVAYSPFPVNFFRAGHFEKPIVVAVAWESEVATIPHKVVPFVHIYFVVLVWYNLKWSGGEALCYRYV